MYNDIVKAILYSVYTPVDQVYEKIESRKSHRLKKSFT